MKDVIYHSDETGNLYCEGCLGEICDKAYQPPDRPGEASSECWDFEAHGVTQLEVGVKDHAHLIVHTYVDGYELLTLNNPVLCHTCNTVLLTPFDIFKLLRLADPEDQCMRKYIEVYPPNPRALI